MLTNLQSNTPDVSGNSGDASSAVDSGIRPVGSHDAQQAASGDLPPPAPVLVADGFEYYAAAEPEVFEGFEAAADLTAVTLTRPVWGNMLTPAGCEKVRTRLSKKLPDLRRARFITLTIDPRRAGAKIDEQTDETVITDEVCVAAYELGKEKLRDFFRRLRHGFAYRWSSIDGCYVPCHPSTLVEPWTELVDGTETTFAAPVIYTGVGEETPYAWKLEFMESGMPHWHLPFLHRRKIPWQAVQAAWMLGGVDVKLIDSKTLNYLFKYVTKAGQGFPDWALDYPRTIRFWQASRGFYTVTGTTRPKTEPKTTRRFETIRQKLARYPTVVRVWHPGQLVQRGRESFTFGYQFPQLREFAPGVRFEDVLVASSHIAVNGLGDAPSSGNKAQLPSHLVAHIVEKAS